MNNLLVQAEQRLNSADAELVDALESGRDTSSARERLSLAQAELDRLRSELAEIEGQDAEFAQEQMAGQAEALVAEQQDRIVAELNRLIAPIKLPVIQLPAGPAVTLLQAQARLSEVQAQAAAAGERLKALRGRLSALRQERGQIVARRAQGDTRPDDGSELALLEADIEGLGGLVTQAQTKMPDTHDSQAAVATAEYSWQRYLAEARITALQALCSNLDQGLAAAAGELSEAVRSVDGPSAARRWRASHALRLNLL